MRITNNIVFNIVSDDHILNLMKVHLDDEDIRKIYRQWNFWSPEVELYGSNTEIRYNCEVAFIGRVLSAVAQVQSYKAIDQYLNSYENGNTAALLSFVLNNVKWSTLHGLGKKMFEGSLLPEIEEQKQWEEKNEIEKKDKKQELLEKVKKEIEIEYPSFKEVFYKKYRDSIASMVFNLNGNVNDSELLERLIEDEMIEDFSNFKIKQIENLLKNS